MKHIDSFTLNGVTYAIETRKLSGVSGQVVSNPPTISIDSSASKDEAKDILLHEILHIILWDCRQNTSGRIRLKEETLVAFLETKLMQAKKENKALFKYLFG